jgi:hypothetical protein
MTTEHCHGYQRYLNTLSLVALQKPYYFVTRKLTPAPYCDSGAAWPCRCLMPVHAPPPTSGPISPFPAW